MGGLIGNFDLNEINKHTDVKRGIWSIDRNKKNHKYVINYYLEFHN